LIDPVLRFLGESEYLVKKLFCFPKNLKIPQFKKKTTKRWRNREKFLEKTSFSSPPLRFPLRFLMGWYTLAPQE
jgi:hypothetical protein